VCVDGASMYVCVVFRLVGFTAQSVAATQSNYYACVVKVATWCGQAKATGSTIHCLYGLSTLSAILLCITVLQYFRADVISLNSVYDWLSDDIVTQVHDRSEG